MANGFTIPDELKLNLGKYPNDGTGDDLYTAFDKIRRTLALINTELGVLDGENLAGDGEGVFSEKVDNKLQFKRINGLSGVSVTSTDTTIDLVVTSNVSSDTSPSLGGDLDLNGRNILGTGTPGTSGDVRATVFGIDIQSLYTQVQTLLSTAPEDMDLGNNWTSTSAPYDFGTWD